VTGQKALHSVYSVVLSLKDPNLEKLNENLKRGQNKAFFVFLNFDLSLKTVKFWFISYTGIQLYAVTCFSSTAFAVYSNHKFLFIEFIL
jgi:hypothetical protein